MIYYQKSLLIWYFQALSVSQQLNKTATNSIIEVRREMFLKGVRDQETMPPTSAALLEHAFCSAYIAGHRWNNQRRI